MTVLLVSRKDKNMEELDKTIEPDCPYVVDGKCIGKNACDLQDKCVFYKDGEQE